MFNQYPCIVKYIKNLKNLSIIIIIICEISLEMKCQLYFLMPARLYTLMIDFVPCAIAYKL